MLIKNIRKFNIFSLNIQKKFFPRVTKKPNPEININLENLTKSIKENPQIFNKISQSENSDDFNLSDLPEFKTQKSLKKILRKEETLQQKLENKISKEMAKHSNSSDNDAHFTGEEVNEIDYDSYYDLYSLARLNDKLPHVPDDIQEMAKKVFSKHSFKDIKFWSEKFLLNYSQNHACEPPIDLKNIPQDSPLMANTEEINLKIKFFKQLDTLKDLNKNNILKNKKSENSDTSETRIKLDENYTIDVGDERKLNKEKENINPIKVEYKQAQAVAYLYCRMPYTYQTCKRILNEIILRMPNFKPKSVLDFGAGLGSAIWAAHHTYGEIITKYAAVEPNRDMRRLGKFLTSTLENDILWVESLTMIPGAGIERGKFDIIFLSHVLQEISTAKLRMMIIETLWNRLSNDGVLIIVEPGSPKGFRFITDIRKWVIDKSRDDANIVGPCPHHKECPLAEKSSTWCHFSQLSYKYNKDTIVKRQSEKQIFNEKFTYLIIKKGKIPSVIYKNEQQAKTPEEKSFFWERIVRPVIKKHQHRIVDLCTKRGTFERRIISKSHGGLGGYKSIKRYNWGDLWYVPLWLPNKFRKERLRGKRLW